MSNHRYSKFWWQDWQRDGALRMCSLAARGFWMELLCLAHDGNPVGHVTVNGKAPTNRQLALIAGCSEKEVTKLMAELEDSGVFSRTDNGVIFSRRMVRDADKSEEGKYHISKRWGGSPPSDRPTRSPTRRPSTQYSEAESESKDRLFSPERKGEREGPEPPSASPVVAGVIEATAKVVKMRAYPPGRWAQRTADEQKEAVTPVKPKTAYLTAEQLARARRRA